MRPLPENLAEAKPAYDIPAVRVLEISASLADMASTLLADKAAVNIGNDYFPGVHFRCPGSTQTFLVRALYEHGSNGMFTVSRRGSALLVRHNALGAEADKHRSSLIVCLDFTPSEVFVDVHGAM